MLPEIHLECQDSRFKIQDSRFKMQDSRFKIQDSRFKIQDSRLDLESEQREACLLLLLPPAVDPVNKATVSVRELRVILTMAQFTCSAMSNVNVLRLLNELLSNMN